MSATKCGQPIPDVPGYASYDCVCSYPYGPHDLHCLVYNEGRIGSPSANH